MQEREKENSWLEAWEEGGDEEYKKGGKGSWKACCPSALSIFQQQHHQDPFLKSPKLLPGFCQENQNQDGRRQPVGDSDEYSPHPDDAPRKRRQRSRNLVPESCGRREQPSWQETMFSCGCRLCPFLLPAAWLHSTERVPG